MHLSVGRSAQIALECFLYVVTLVVILALPSCSLPPFLYCASTTSTTSTTTRTTTTLHHGRIMTTEQYYARGTNEKQKEKKGDDGNAMDRDALIFFRCADKKALMQSYPPHR
jgi:hypothetical protein